MRMGGIAVELSSELVPEQWEESTCAGLQPIYGSSAF